MLESNVAGLLTSIGAALGALVAVIATIIKFGNWLTSRRGDSRQWEREDFEAVIGSLKEENARCWVENGRQREAIAALEKRLTYRRDENHWLNNQLSAYMLQYGDVSMQEPRPEPPVDEDGRPQ